jgi:hypothetical protein
MDVAHSTVFHLCMPDLNADLPPEIANNVNVPIDD